MSKEIIIKTNKTVNYVYMDKQESSVQTVFLHGFTGTHRSWSEVAMRLNHQSIALDLPGHGKSVFNNLSSNYSIIDWVQDFTYILDNLGLDKINLCGYSMGGRLAIAFAVNYPERVDKLILESASYGLECSKDRALRAHEDLALSNLIEEDFNQFVQKWQNNVLFKKQQDRNPAAFLNQQKDRFSHNSTQLAKALNSFGQGCMNYYYKELSDFKFPVTIIAGSEDVKYVEIAREMSRLCKLSKLFVVPDSGHNVHLEKTNQFIECLK